MKCVCNNCGEEFISNGRCKKYCSEICRRGGISKKLRKYNYDVDIKLKCELCEKILSYDQAKRGNKFCSYECFRKYMHIVKQNDLNKVELRYCEICKKILSKDQIRNGCRTCSCSCAAKLRYIIYGPHKLSKDHKEKFLSGRARLSESDEYRKKVSDRMKNNNPSKNPEVVEKMLKTRYANGNLHKWCGIRGGNGKMSKCEQMLFSPLSDLGFLYNCAIPVREIRLNYPDRHYPTNYKPDFTNFDKMLCVEIDGKSHNSCQQRCLDIKKEECLNMLGFRVIRFSNDDVLSKFDLVVETIREELK